MFKSDLLILPQHDARWFYDSVAIFNGIGNPNGVDYDKQLPIILSEMEELADSTTNNEFIDGIIDVLVTVAPLVPRDTFLLYPNEINKEALHYDVFERDTKTFADYVINNPEQSVDWSTIVKVFLTVITRLDNYEDYMEMVCDSNLSKFIPVGRYKEDHFEEVKHKYPDVNVVIEQRRYNGQEYKVFLNGDTGKILKGHSYFKDVDFDKLI